jgi:hypothetical protein
MTTVTQVIDSLLAKGGAVDGMSCQRHGLQKFDLVLDWHPYSIALDALYTKGSLSVDSINNSGMTQYKRTEEK